MDIDLAKFKTVHEQALKLASEQANKKLIEIGGDRMGCGFAWVTIYGVRKNSKFGKLLQSLGFSKDYRNAFVLWNPSKLSVQNIDAKEVGADTYGVELKKAFPEMRIYSESRLD